MVVVDDVLVVLVAVLVVEPVVDDDVELIVDDDVEPVVKLEAGAAVVVDDDVDPVVKLEAGTAVVVEDVVSSALVCKIQANNIAKATPVIKHRRGKNILNH